MTKNVVLKGQKYSLCSRTSIFKKNVLNASNVYLYRDDTKSIFLVRVMNLSVDYEY